MLYDCMQVFMEEAKSTQADYRRRDTDTEKELISKLAIDHYVPKDGTYVLLNVDKEFSKEYQLDIYVDKKTGEIVGNNDSRYQYIRYLDYNSKLIAMNKPMDSKKVIHSNNMYTFFLKKDSITSGKLTPEVIDGYFNTLANPEMKYSKPRAKKLYQQVEQEIGIVNREVLEKIRTWIKGWIQDLSILPIEITGKDYLKLFFVYQNESKTKQIYENENKRYMIPNIFNNNDYNIEIGETVLGLPSNNMGLNAKKPFLENKTRKTVTPYLIDLNEVVWQNRFFDYLYGQASIGKVNIYFDFDKPKIYAIADKCDVPEYIDSGVYLRIRKGKEVEILDSNTIIALNPNLEHTFSYKTILEGNDDNVMKGECNTRSQLAAVIDEVFFGKTLSYNFFTEPESLSITDGVLENVLLTYRDRLFEWLYRNPKCDMKQLLEEMAMKLVQNSMKSGFQNKARQQLNLLLLLQDYLNQDMRMEEMMEMVQEAFKKHMGMHKEEWDFENDSEYYFAVGQLIDYFLSLSKSAKKPLSLANPFLEAKDDSLIKEKLGQMFAKYSYAIDSIIDIRAKNIISHVMLYIPKTTVQQQYLIAGLTASSAFYMKKEN